MKKLQKEKALFTLVSNKEKCKKDFEFDKYVFRMSYNDFSVAKYVNSDNNIILAKFHKTNCNMYNSKFFTNQETYDNYMDDYDYLYDLLQDFKD